MTDAIAWRRFLLAVGVCIAAALPGAGARAQLPHASATLAGAPVVTYNWSRDRCSMNDVPDSQARAFRDASGTMHLFVIGTEGYAWVGPDLAHLHHDCHPALLSVGSTDPARYADAMWLVGFYTADGRIVHALVHDEFHGFRRGGPCSSANIWKCMDISVMAAISKDGGENFVALPPPAGIVAASPYRYEPDVGAIGFMNPSSIVPMGGYYYVAVNAIGYRAQKGGICLMRTANLDDPSSWRAWDGTGFTVAFVDPYVQANVVPERSVCTTLGPSVDGIVAVSIVRHLPDNVFVMIGEQQAAALAEPGKVFRVAVASTSRDLINWSPAVPLLPPEEARQLGSVNYPTLLDPASTDRNFATIGDAPELIYTHGNAPGGDWHDQDMRHVPLRLRLAPPP